MTPSVQIAGGRRVTRWTREAIVQKMLEWRDRHGEPPCSADWNPSLARWRAQEWRIERYRDGRWPSTNAVKRAFGGSFDAAVVAAGLTPARPGPRPRRAAGAADGAVAAARADAAGFAALRRRVEAAERRADRAEERLRDARKRARAASERAARAQQSRDRAYEDADARVRAALDQADAAIRDADALRAQAAGRARPAAEQDAVPAGPAVLGAALRRLASARATGDRGGLVRELGAVADAAARWRERL